MTSTQFRLKGDSIITGNLTDGTSWLFTRPAKVEPIGARRLYVKHADFVAGFVARLGVCSTQIDNAVHEVFMLAHRAGGYMEGRATERSWLGAFGVRVAKKLRREGGCDGVSCGRQGAPCAKVHGRTPSAKTESWQRVQRALPALDDVQRAVFVLFELEGEECASIAAALDMPLSSVHMRLKESRSLFLDAMNY